MCSRNFRRDNFLMEHPMITPTQLIRTQVRSIDGLSVRFAESEPRDRHALLLSPWPESIYCYEPTWTRLAEHTHLVAVDLPGFGKSERRNALMAPKEMGDFDRPNCRRFRPRQSTCRRAGCRNGRIAFCRRAASRSIPRTCGRHRRHRISTAIGRRTEGNGWRHQASSLIAK